MAYEAIHRFAQISPRKARLIADLIRGKFADEALEILKYQPQRSARMLEKVLRSALANAEDRRAPNLNTLMVSDVRIDGGPIARRMRPHARGMSSVIKKRTSHIRVALD
ncbi:MAG TPA: 50S ribosomal protein L22 [Thermoguttaceae bacterium]|nr:50S ribosomal protein L22 [Thermoguttaceae bacterium]